MSLIKYEPVETLNRIRNDISKMFNAFWQWPSYFDEEESSIVTSQWSPAVDIKEEENQFVIRADLPGIEPKNIEVSMENGCLTIKGERVEENEEERKGYKRSERFHGTFYRRFSMPDIADSEKISAVDKNGVLEITIGKKSGVESRKIEVKS